MALITSNLHQSTTCGTKDVLSLQVATARSCPQHTRILELLGKRSDTWSKVFCLQRNKQSIDTNNGILSSVFQIDKTVLTKKNLRLCFFILFYTHIFHSNYQSLNSRSEKDETFLHIYLNLRGYSLRVSWEH